MTAYSMKQDKKGDLVQTKPHWSSEEKLTDEEKAYRDAVEPLLLMRAYHLPGNDWKQDWVQYMTNNHPMFGICWHHKYHPVKRNVRIAGLIGSILFGLALTNIIYLAFVFTDIDYETTYVEVKGNFTTGQADVDSNVNTLTVSNGNIALWTIGAAVHALYDNVIWSLAACTCCMDKGITEEKLARYKSTGVWLVMLSVVVVTAVATFAVTLRAALDSSDEPTQVDVLNQSKAVGTDTISVWEVSNANDYEFLIAYFVEIALSYFFYYPVVGTLLFSGLLTCGRYPTVGGRPYEIKQEMAEHGATNCGMEHARSQQPSKRSTKKKSISREV